MSASTRLKPIHDFHNLMEDLSKRF
jgi:hypothetical protein